MEKLFVYGRSKRDPAAVSSAEGVARRHKVAVIGHADDNPARVLPLLLRFGKPSLLNCFRLFNARIDVKVRILGFRTLAVQITLVPLLTHVRIQRGVLRTGWNVAALLENALDLATNAAKPRRTTRARPIGIGRTRPRLSGAAAFLANALDLTTRAV
jgi:hypothetical protein